MKPSIFSIGILFGISILLCRCAVKHQPVKFDPYFAPQANPYYLPEILKELGRLERKSDLSLYEKKKLTNLYQSELRFLEESTEKYALVKEKIRELAPIVAPLNDELVNLQLAEMKSIPRQKVKRTRFASAKRGPLVEVRERWNKNENQKALGILNQRIREGRFRSRATKMQAEYLRFRIALELQQLRLVAMSVKRLTRWSRCDSRSIEARFLHALIIFARGGAAKALTLINEKCELTRVQRTRLLYWKARMQLSIPKTKALAHATFMKLATSFSPSYYELLSWFYLKKKFPPPGPSSQAFLQQPWDTNEQTHQLLLKAENYLRAGLRKEARMFVLSLRSRLSREVSEDDVHLRLYLAHLFRAIGDPLESLKIYNRLLAYFREEEISQEQWAKYRFTEELYPRPFQTQVNWLSRMWGVDPDFVYSIIRQESGFLPGATSRAKAQGLMQLMPFVASSLSEQWGYDRYYEERYLSHAEENLKLAIFHLGQLQAELQHPVFMACAYNAGTSRVKRWWRRFGKLPADLFIELIPINETRTYAKLVTRNHIYYRALRTGDSVSSEIFPWRLPFLKIKSVR